jgi:hypothetical protein
MFLIMEKIKKTFYIAAIASIGVLKEKEFVFAQSTIEDARDFLGQTHEPTGLSPTTDAVEVSIMVIQVGLGLVGFIFLCLMVYAGFMWMLDRGNEDRAAKAKATFTAATAGVVVIVAAYAIATFITDFVSG